MTSPVFVFFSMFATFSPFQQLFIGVAIVAVIMIITVSYLSNSDSFKNTDRLMGNYKK
tara:strand:+ start:796 stop:969 length:174 start_codon:yes stop_codon:yes gene_type:complete